MDMQLLEHGRMKFPRANLLASSAGRSWAGVHAERRRHPAGELPAHLAAVTEITYALAGVPEAVVERSSGERLQVAAVTQGALWITPEGALESATRITAPLDDILHVCLPRGLFDSLADDTIPGVRPEALPYASGLNDPLVGHMMRDLAGELESETSSGALKAEVTALALAARLAGLYGQDARTRPPLPRLGLDARRLRRVLEFINARLETSITIDDLAQVACLSPFHFARAFKLATGQTPHAFLSARRLERAKSLLRYGARPLGEIALKCGFSSQASFTKAFTRATGCSPGRYRLPI